MNYNSSLQFTSDLRQLLEATSRIVWDSQEISQVELGDWPESSFANSLIVHGLLGSDSRTKDIRARLRYGKPYSIDFDYTIHQQQKMEPITGADIAVLVDIKIDREIIQHKLFLVQLKRAHIDNGKILFPELHYNVP